MSDFFESARSSGVIGVGLIIFLLIGFGALFLAVFDDRLNGENASKLKGRLHDQGADIYALEGEIEWAESALVAQKQMGILHEKVERSSKVLEVLTRKETALTEEIKKEKEAIEQIGKEQLAYREEYRVVSRKRAIGETFDEITLANGKVLKKVKIREILPDKIRFTTPYGTTNVRWEEFSNDMRERFQIGEGELEAYQAKLVALRAKRFEMAAEGKSEHAVYLREMELKRRLSQLERSLRDKKGKRDKASLKVSALQTKAASYRAKYGSVSNTTYYSEYSGYYSTPSATKGKGYLNAAIRTEKEASSLSSKINVANVQIQGLEEEKQKLERELNQVKAKR